MGLPCASAQLPLIDLSLPYAWGGPVGGGVIRLAPEDFQVVEVPLVEPCGEGEHSWLYVRKRGANTQWVARQLARHAGVSGTAVGYAGLKDRHALSEQWFSVHLPGRSDPDWGVLDHPDLQVLQIHRHTRKLKRGALRGNRFRLVVRDVTAAPGDVEARLSRLAGGGFPNAFGPQRFGHNGANIQAAAGLLQNPRARMPRDKRSILLSAVRAALFNRILALRMEDASWNTALPGEALQLDGRSACFVCTQMDALIRERLAALEVHPTGPLCGDGDSLPEGAAARYENERLQPYAAWIDALHPFRLHRERRALRAVARELTWKRESARDWVLEFCLTPGTYATSLLREVFDVHDAAQAAPRPAPRG